jgi:hypothetical protein
MIDHRLDNVEKNESFFSLKQRIQQMLTYHGFKSDLVLIKLGTFYDAVTWEVDFNKEGKTSYSIAATMKLSEMHLGPKKVEGHLLDMLANNKFEEIHHE